MKRDWLKRKEAPKNKDTSKDRFSDLKKDIVVMRKQGQPPVKDPNTFASASLDRTVKVTSNLSLVAFHFNYFFECI